jgi:exodeoxyribonuclease V alpha subunit
MTTFLRSAFDEEITVRRRRFAQENTGFAVLEAVADDGKPLVLVGPLVHLEERERAHVLGTWVNDSRYGPQVRVSQARPLAPADADSLRALLVRVRHVGSKRAQRVIERYGAEHVLAVIDENPETAFAGAGLGRGRAREAALSWEELRSTRLLHMLLAPHGLAYLAPKIHAEYGPRAHRVVRERPYELTSVFGVGFQLADRIARAIGSGGDEGDRARAGALHLLSEAERGGSTCMADERLLAELRELLGDPVDGRLLDGLLERGKVERDGCWIYRAETARLEAELAERLAQLRSLEPSERLRAPREDEIAATGLQPNPAQFEALGHAFTTKLSLITGGPGTGKTSSIRTIARCAVTQGARVMLVAPTGRAAVRMSEASGLKARTVHSALGWVPGEGPDHDAESPLRCDLLIVDECSMANLELLVTLLRAVGRQTSVVLVGDADQLAPVGAGKPFAELVGSGLVPVTKLRHIFRQAAGSMIVQGAHAVRAGRSPGFAPAFGMRRDLFMIERADPVRAREEIVSLVAERLPAHYRVDPLSDIQVFAPVYRGELGIERLNDSLRDVLNPDGRPVRGGRLRLGDKVMLTGRNLHDLGLMNGTLLRVLEEVGVAGEDEAGSGDVGGADPALLLSSDEAVFRLPLHESDRLGLAYACSVHRGQGIELPVAVIVAHPAAGAFFLRREMLYTAITRAKLATVIVGTRQAVERAARTTDTSARHSRLAERLRRMPGQRSVHTPRP